MNVQNTDRHTNYTDERTNIQTYRHTDECTNNETDTQHKDNIFCMAISISVCLFVFGHTCRSLSDGVRYLTLLLKFNHKSLSPVLTHVWTLLSCVPAPLRKVC